MIVEYIPQGHRFDIYEDIGCYTETYNTPVAVVLVYVPPVLIGCVCAVYAGASIFPWYDLLTLTLLRSF
jgi:pheromone a factor receptor